MAADSSLLKARPMGSTCAACATASTGGTCPNCGLYWYRNEAGKIVGVRLPAQVVQPSKPTEEKADFWRNAEGLREAVKLAERFEPRFAEAVEALGHLWNIVVFQLLSDQQAMALLHCHTRRTLSSRELSGALSISHQGASNVLQQLVKKGLLRRERQGRSVRYGVALLWPMGSAPKAAQIVTRKRGSSS